MKFCWIINTYFCRIHKANKLPFVNAKSISAATFYSTCWCCCCCVSLFVSPRVFFSFHFECAVFSGNEQHFNRIFYKLLSCIAASINSIAINSSRLGHEMRMHCIKLSLLISENWFDLQEINGMCVKSKYCPGWKIIERDLCALSKCCNENVFHIPSVYRGWHVSKQLLVRRHNQKNHIAKASRKTACASAFAERNSYISIELHMVGHPCHVPIQQ